MKPLILALVIGFGLQSTAQAYVPPSQFMVQQMAKKRTKLKGLRIKTRITGTQNQIKEIAWYDASTKKIKARILDVNDAEIYAFERKMSAQDSLVGVILFESQSSVIEKALKSYQVPIVTQEQLQQVANEDERRALEKTSIGRLDQKIGWVIGQGSPSFWVLKDEFTPLLLKVKSGGGDLEVRFEDTKNIREFPYARSISLYRGGDFVLKGEAMEVMVNPDLADMKSIQVTGTPSIPSHLDSATQKLIEQWVQWIR
jgi:hypothetical protein